MALKNIDTTSRHPWFGKQPEQRVNPYAPANGGVKVESDQVWRDWNAYGKPGDLPTPAGLVNPAKPTQDPSMHTWDDWYAGSQPGNLPAPRREQTPATHQVVPELGSVALGNRAPHE